MKYYHITPTANKEIIIKKGLKSKLGMIFLFSKTSIAKNIATNQLGLDSYSMFEIKLEGITGELINDAVAEFSAQHQWIVKNQKVIKPEHIKHLKDVSDNPFDAAEEQNLKMNLAMGDKNPWLSLEDLVRKNPKWLEHYNKKYNKKLNLKK